MKRTRLAAAILTAAATTAGFATAVPAHAASGTAASVSASVVTAASLPASGADPRPECSGGTTKNCWEYKTWYWTYSGCEDDGYGWVDGSRYDDYQCAGDHGAVVWLWLHRR